MDGIVSSAIEEICLEGRSGVALPKLWSLLLPHASSSGLDLCDAVKRVVWTRLHALQCLQFLVGADPMPPRDPSIQSFEDAEKLGVRVLAAEHLRDSCLGITELMLNSRKKFIADAQRRLLERIARSRGNGVTQDQLGKELGLQGNEVFYHLKGFECSKVIIRHSANLWEGSSRVNTNIITLYRYAQHLNLSAHQRFEITKQRASEGQEGEDAGDPSKSLTDYLPAMEAICRRLEEAEGQVLLVSDIKSELGYQGNEHKKAWKNVITRLLEAKLVEKCFGRINSNRKKRSTGGKNVTYLHLLRKFNLKDFDLNSEHYEEKKGQFSEQVMELPIDHQIYDIIDAEGPNGITLPEIYKRLGLNSKKAYNRIIDMDRRFGLKLGSEGHNRTKTYRIWALGNVVSDLGGISDRNKSSISYGQSSTLSISSESGAKEIFSAESGDEKGGLLVGSSSQIEGDKSISFPSNSKESGAREIFSAESGDEKGGLLVGSSSQIEGDKSIRFPSNSKSDQERKHFDSDDPEVPLSLAITSVKLQGQQRHSCLDVTITTMQRKQRILSRLEKDKFILRLELHKWLESLEVEKSTKMDKRTLLRVLGALENDGLCKCLTIRFPSWKNHLTDRYESVIFHPSSLASISELQEQIHKRLRDFELEYRGSSKPKGNYLPQNLSTNAQSSRSVADIRHSKNSIEAMRVNGFIPAKMVRVKLLHNFLWSVISSLPDWQDFLFSAQPRCDRKNLQSTLKSFELDAAIKELPVELFLQAVGFAGVNDNFVEYCQSGLRLSDLAVEEYECLIDTNSMSRLSSLIDILVRLKLMQLVLEETAAASSAVHFTHALELKPYIEIPSGQPYSEEFSNSQTRMRRDFFFLNREDIDTYWQTLEDYYAAGDRRFSLKAFPGSVVPEVCAARSWSSVRVMSSEQRLKLSKRLANNDPREKVSFQQCLKIAQELHLTLDQVLCAAYERKRKSPDMSHTSEATGGKRMRFIKHDVQGDIEIRKHLKIQEPDTNDRVGQIRTSKPTDQSSDSSGDEDLELGTKGDHNGNCSFISQCAFSGLRPRRQRKFHWNDELDRQLIIQYARYRAIRGSSFNRVDWASLSNLPANAGTCKRRMATLNGVASIRNAVMNLCNLLGKKYTNYLDEKAKNESQVCSDSRQIFGDSSTLLCPTQSLLVSQEFSRPETSSQVEDWDNFENPNIKMAVDEVLRCKRKDENGIPRKCVSKLKRKRPESKLLDGTDSDAQAYVHLKKQSRVSSPNIGEENIHPPVGHGDSNKISASGRKKFSSHRIQRRILKFMSNRDMGVTRGVAQSLAIASAIELLKLVFLSTSAAPEEQTLLSEALRQYSQSELYAAFSYLRSKNFMVIGHGSRPFVLSLKFLSNASSSPFPIDSGRRAAVFSSWLKKQKQDVFMDDIDLNMDLQCGEVFHIVALVSSGEITLSTGLPKEGVGEIDDSQNIKDKEKTSYNYEIKIKDSDFCLRREKGFPGIQVVLHHKDYAGQESCDFVALSLTDNYVSLCDDKNKKCSSLSSQNFHYSASLDDERSEPLWQTMTSYAEQISLMTDSQKLVVSPELMESLYTSVRQAGEHGLNMEEIAKTVPVQGRCSVGIFVDTLEAFQLVVKVQAYDSIRVLDSSYKLKYFIPIFTGHNKSLTPKLQLTCTEAHKEQVAPENCQTSCQTQLETRNNCDGDKTMILDLPKMSEKCSIIDQPESGGPMSNNFHPMDALSTDGSSCPYRPVLPWIDSDGSTNTILYKGLVRRILGIVMQNPGILEENLIRHIDVLNPQSCRQLLELMILDNHITVRKIFQAPSRAPPVILQGIIKSKFVKSEALFRNHLFANPMSTQHL